MVYIDDIVIPKYYATWISQLKDHLFSHFQTKYLSYLTYFVVIEVA